MNEVKLVVREKNTLKKEMDQNISTFWNFGQFEFPDGEQKKINFLSDNPVQVQNFPLGHCWKNLAQSFGENWFWKHREIKVDGIFWEFNDFDGGPIKKKTFQSKFLVQIESFD